MFHVGKDTIKTSIVVLCTKDTIIKVIIILYGSKIESVTYQSVEFNQSI